MFDRTYYATHPDMMVGASNDELRDRYLIQNLFRPNQCVLNYTHADRLVIGGVLVDSGSVKLPDQSEPASAAASRCRTCAGAIRCATSASRRMGPS